MSDTDNRLPGTGAAYPSDLEQEHGVDPTDPPVTAEPPAIADGSATDDSSVGIAARYPFVDDEPTTPAEAYEQDQVTSIEALGEDR